MGASTDGRYVLLKHDQLRDPAGTVGGKAHSGVCAITRIMMERSVASDTVELLTVGYVRGGLNLQPRWTMARRSHSFQHPNFGESVFQDQPRARQQQKQQQQQRR